MPICSVRSAALVGVDAAPVTVTAEIAPGLSAFRVVGLSSQPGPQRELRIRVTAAIKNSGLDLPPGIITVTLSPADVRKDSAAFDLPVALAVLGAAGTVPPASLDGVFAAGELALDGTVRAVRGAFAFVADATLGTPFVLVPADNAVEAQAGDAGRGGIAAVRHLSQAVAWLRGEPGAVLAAPVAPLFAPATGPCNFADIAGQDDTIRDITAAVACGLNVLLVGPPGAGKCMIARRVGSVLPPLTQSEAHECARVFSAAGLLGHDCCLPSLRPFRAPHHTISDAGLVGGGAGIPRPGELSLAHNGVLFLDELPEFRRSSVEALRGAVAQARRDAGRAMVHSGRVPVWMPARPAVIVGAANPCACGYRGVPNAGRECCCSADAFERYDARLRTFARGLFDVAIPVRPVRAAELLRDAPRVQSATMRARLLAARELLSATPALRDSPSAVRLALALATVHQTEQGGEVRRALSLLSPLAPSAA